MYYSNFLSLSIFTCVYIYHYHFLLLYIFIYVFYAYMCTFTDDKFICTQRFLITNKYHEIYNNTFQLLRYIQIFMCVDGNGEIKTFWFFPTNNNSYL